MQGRWGRQVPFVGGGVAGAVRTVKLGLPRPEILLLGQPPRRPQTIDHGGIGRVAVEKPGIDFPQYAIGGIVERQIVIGAEYGDRGRQLVERAPMGVDRGGKVGPQRFEFGHVLTYAGAAARCRRFEDVEDAAYVADIDAGAPRLSASRGMRA